MTISDIAKMAGVSAAAVSRYLNNGYISEEKKERIREVIEKTGYVPSAQAQMLRTKRTKLIGVIIPKINSDSISRVVAGISTVLRENGYQLLLGNTENDADREIDFMRIFTTNQVDGIILLGTFMTPKLYQVIAETKTPVVLIGQKSKRLPCVYHDDEMAAYELTKILIHGRKTPGYIGVTNKDEAVGERRRKGFEKALADYGQTISENSMKEAHFSAESGYVKAEELWQDNPDVDALFCATDGIAMGAVQYLRKIGKKIPEDVAVVGFGDSNISKVMTPKLTTIHFYYKTSGSQAAKMILDIIQDEAALVQEIKLGFEVVENESTR